MYVDLFEEALSIDWPTRGDEFLHHMWVALGERISLRGYQYLTHEWSDEEPYFYFGYKVTSGDLSSELVLLPTSTGIRFLVKISDQTRVPREVEPWVGAIMEAVGRLDDVHPKFEWWAAVGPVGLQLRGAQFVTNEATIGEMVVHPSKKIFLEAVEGPAPTIGGHSVQPSFPVVVEGVSSGYDWLSATESVPSDLNMLCALLSVAFDANWRIRQIPNPGSKPDSELPQERLGTGVHAADNSGWQSESVAIPSWCATAWRKAVDDDVIATALHAHHTALALEEISPSFALIAYVGVLEGLGAKLVPLKRCECCDNCTAMVGSGRRFREALKLVLPRKEVRQLEEVYERRSKTAHEGRLHGDEVAGMFFPPRVFAPRPENLDFRYQLVWKMRNASRKLLMHYLAPSDECS